MKPKRTFEEVSFSRSQGRIIHALRTKQNLTRSQLAARSGVNEWHIYRLEMGETMASAFQIDALAVALAAPREMFFPACAVVKMHPVLQIPTVRRAYA